MIPIIQELLDAEKRAEQIVADARERVQNERSALDSKEHEQLQEAREQCDKRLQEAIREAREEAESRFDRAVTETTGAMERFRSENRAKIDQAITRVVTEVFRTDLDVNAE